LNWKNGILLQISDRIFHNNAEEVATQIQLDKDITKFARNAATTFAPRASGATSNPAYKGKYNLLSNQNST
jgi:hypothetical protein